MNLQQLRYAVALAEAKSFTKAAAEMFVVQSGLSQQVRRLEQELGLQLFERTTRSVSLTPAGESLMPLLHQVVAGVVGGEAAQHRPRQRIGIEGRGAAHGTATG